MSSLQNMMDYSPTTLSKNITDFLTSYGRKKTHIAGAVLAYEGEVSSSVYIVLGGQAEVVKEDVHGCENVIARVGQGTIIGEMGVFLEQKRTGTIRASSDLTVLEFSNDNFLQALNRIPELAFRMYKSLSTKIVNSNDTLVHQSGNQSLLTIAIVLLEMKPAKIANHLGQITLHPSQVSDETGVDRKTIRNILEQLKEKLIITASNITHDGSVMLTIDFSRLGTYCKALVNKKTGGKEKPTVKKPESTPRRDRQYELPTRQQGAYANQPRFAR
ncbi:MAG: Crp/Fnr family transcriptional regulator [Gammaproteobacteria bacterium]|nr:Crp/Fnr family transcriptional regulator [Gammaproteobacteria bacterium]